MDLFIRLLLLVVALYKQAQGEMYACFNITNL